MDNLSNLTIIIALIIELTVCIIPMWFIFKKAGIESWKSIIPIYNTYMLFDISWNTSMFSVYIIGAFASGILESLQSDSALFSIVYTAVTIAYFIVSVIFKNKLAKAFGKGTGFTIGLICLPFIFEMILAFGKSEYQGPQ